MGTFDTYHIGWGDSAEQVQTKQLDAGMRDWVMGKRVPLAEIDFSERYEAPGSTAPGSLPAGCDPFRILIEDSTLSHSWHNPSLCDRHFVLGHLDGRFADYSAARHGDEADELSAMMRSAWAPQEMGIALARQFRLIQERNDQAMLSRAKTLANIDPTYREWRKNLAATKAEQPAPDSQAVKHKAFFAFFDSYYGPDFSGISRLAVAKGLDELCLGWELSLMDFDSSIDYPRPVNRAQEAALACSRGHARAMLTMGSLGAPNPVNIGAPSEPAALADPASASRAQELLRRGLWRLYEHDARELVDDADFVQSSRASLASLCSSRVGSFWVAGFIARNPAFDFGHIRLRTTDIPLVDWMSIHMGLPTRLLAPLIEAGVAASPTLAHHCLIPPHHAMLDLALSQAGGVAKIPPWNGASFVVQAARCSSLSALTTAQAAGLLDINSPEAAVAIEEANIAEARCANSLGYRSTPNSWPDPLPPTLACAVYLHELGLPSRGEMSERLLACLSMREKQSLSNIIGQAPIGPRPYRI